MDKCPKVNNFVLFGIFCLKKLNKINMLMNIMIVAEN